MVLGLLPQELRVHILSIVGEEGTIALLRAARTCRWMHDACWAAMRVVVLDFSEIGRRLELAAGQDRLKAAAYATMASSTPWLRTLTASRLLRRCPHLQVLDLGGTGGQWGVQDDFIIEQCAGQQQGDEDSRVVVVPPLGAGRDRPSLQTIRARDAGVETADCLRLAQLCLPALTELELSMNMIGNDGLCCLQGHLSQCRRLALADCG
eukprot:COSAG05_NODE_6481_length_949_cov_1.472941_1_plen_207_part_10